MHKASFLFNMFYDREIFTGFQTLRHCDERIVASDQFNICTANLYQPLLIALCAYTIKYIVKTF